MTKGNTSLRDKLRASVFSPDHGETKLITFRGADVEVRSPSLDAMLTARELAKKDRKQAIVRSIINYVYVPGTNEILFEPADEQAILNFPFDKDMLKLQNAINELTGIDLEEEAKKAEEEGAKKKAEEEVCVCVCVYCIFVYVCISTQLNTHAHTTTQ